jgi:arylsulfatase A-like enzyme
MIFRRLCAPVSLLALGLLAAGAAGLAPRGDAVAGPATAAEPNIILILTDDQDLLLGSLDVMPRLHELLIDQGTFFTNAYVPLSLCCPSRATILTGRYTHNLQVYTNFPPDGGFQLFKDLGHEGATVGVALQRAGYRTALLGKYLNGYPNKLDRTYVPPGWNEWSVPAAGSPYAGLNYTLNHNGKMVPHGRQPADYLTDVLAQQARDFVTKAAADKVPFFLYFAPFAPHKPSTPAPRDAQLFPDAKAPRTPSFNEADMKDKPKEMRGKPLLTDKQIHSLDQLYRRRLQALQSIDAAIATLVEALESTGQLDNTFLVFTSDNGLHMGQHRLPASKYRPYEEDIRVPLIVRGPGVPAGARVDAFIENVDLAPTIAQLAGAKLPVRPDGRSFVPFLAAPQRPPANWRQMVFLEQYHFDERPQDDEGLLEPSDQPAGEEHVTHLGLRTATYKLVEYGTGEREYYDLVRDPYELQSAPQELSGAQLRRLTERVHALATCRRSTCRDLEAAPLAGSPSGTMQR